MTSRGYFGVAIYRPKTTNNVGSLWRSATLYGAAFLGTVGHRYQRQPSDTMVSAKAVPLIHYRDLDDLVAHLPHGCPLVGVELDDRAVSLDTFVHPQRALYLLGAEDDGLPRAVRDACHYLVRIPTVVPVSMNVACAGSVLLFHRYMGAVSNRMTRGRLN